MSAANPLPDIVLQNGTAEAGRAEPAAGNLPQKKMNRHPDSEKISYLSENKTA